MVASKDLKTYYRIPPDLRDLNYGKFIDKGETQISDSAEYTSHNTNQLNLKEMLQLLMSLSFIKAITLPEVDASLRSPSKSRG